MKSREESSEFLQAVGLKLKRIRMSKGISQRQMAASCPIEVSFLSKVEGGKANASLCTIKVICDYLEVSPSVLFDEYNLEKVIRKEDCNSVEMV